MALLPHDKTEVEPVCDLLKSMAPVGRAPLDNLNLPLPLARVAHDAVVLGTALEKFMGGFTTERCCQWQHWKTSPTAGRATVMHLLSGS